jgi:hypothetical protein
VILSVRALAGEVDLALDEPDDLNRLKVVIEAPDVTSARTAIGPAGRLESHDVAWLDVAALRTLSGRSDPEWGSRFEAMLSYATVQGWTSADGERVRAHCEWRRSPATR